MGRVWPTAAALLLLLAPALAGCHDHHIGFRHGDRLPRFTAVDVFGAEFDPRALGGPLVLHAGTDTDLAPELATMADLAASFPHVAFVTLVTPRGDPAAAEADLRSFGAVANWWRAVDADGSFHGHAVSDDATAGVFGADGRFQGTMKPPTASCLGTILNSPAPPSPAEPRAEWRGLTASAWRRGGTS